MPTVLTRLSGGALLAAATLVGASLVCVAPAQAAVAAALRVVPVAAAAPAVPVAAAAWGPPAICHPIEIGEARSLPWNAAEAFGTRADYDLKDVVDDTRAILRGTPDALVHMETVRRAVIYLTGIGGRAHSDVDEAWRAREIARLVDALKADIVDAQLDDGADAEAGRRVALAWFDAGYALCALNQAGRHVQGLGPEADVTTGLVMVGKAATLLPQDGTVQLGASIAHFGEGRPDRACYAHLDRALQAVDDPDGLLRRNVLATMGGFLGAKDHDELARKVRAALERT